jgi:hypothetical protein
VSLDGRTLVIKGEKQQETKTEEKNYHLTERSYGVFERSFYLPDGVDADAINAAVAKGGTDGDTAKAPRRHRHGEEDRSENRLIRTDRREQGEFAFAHPAVLLACFGHPALVGDFDEAEQP